MSPSRSSLTIVGLTVAANLILFILGAQFLFLKNVHHHWVFPFEALILGVQYVLFSHRGVRPARQTALVLMALLGVMAIARWETIHTCSSHCVPKLGLALAVAACAIVIGWGFNKNRGSG